MKNRIRKSRSILNRDGFYYGAIIIVLILYLVFIFVIYRVDDTFDNFVKRITTGTALVSAIAFWLQYKRSERLNESSFVMNLNNQFIGNKDMTKIEHELELYYNQYLQFFSKTEPSYASVSKIHLGLDLSRTGEDCQKLINYLVYLESLAVMVDNGVLHLKVIDDLFSYRFFLAVNNPIVQEAELFPYSDFYRGTYILSKKWIKDHHMRKIPIPMEEFCLSEKRLNSYKGNKDYNQDLSVIEKINDYINMLCKNKYRYPKTLEFEGISYDCSYANENDNKEQISACLYESDPFIYPAAFGEEKAKAIKAISRIIGMDNCLLDYKYLYLIRYNQQVIGTALIFDGKSSWHSDKILERIGNDCLSIEQEKESFMKTSKNYFELFTKKKLKNGGCDIEIVSFCIEEGFRGKGAALVLMKELLKTKECQGKVIKLDVLSNNDIAIDFYNKAGFEFVGEETDGFSEARVKPKVRTMIKRVISEDIK